MPFSHQRISQRAVQTSLEKQLDPLDPMGPIASPGVSVSTLSNATIATCHFPGGGPDPSAPSGSAHASTNHIHNDLSR